MIKKFYKKVIAQRPEDLSIISALCSQAKVKQSDIKYLKNNINPKEIVIGMGAGSISNWIRELPKFLK